MNIPEFVSGVDTWIFDLDDTLYPRSAGIYERMLERVVSFIQRLVGVDESTAHALHGKYYHDYGSSMVGLVRHHGADPIEILDYVHDIDISAIRPDYYENELFSRFPGRRIVFTNGSYGHASRVLERLGIASYFQTIFSMEKMQFVGKPDYNSYRSLITSNRIEPRNAIFFDDRLVNLTTAKTFGIRTVLVSEQDQKDDEVPEAHVITRSIPAFAQELTGCGM